MHLQASGLPWVEERKYDRAMTHQTIQNDPNQNDEHKQQLLCFRSMNN
jgi:hypothetical protein